MCHVVRQADIPALPAAVVKQPERLGGGAAAGATALYSEEGGREGEGGAGGKQEQIWSLCKSLSSVCFVGDMNLV